MKKSSILLSSINQFYADQNNRNKLLTILNKSGGISLRNLEWFIKLFDPFCRAEKFTYRIPETSEEIQTTLAQLNFIKWVIKNSILDFIQEHKTLLRPCNQKLATPVHS